MEKYSFDNGLKNEKRNVIILANVNGFIAYANKGTPEESIAAYIKDNEDNLIRFNDGGFVIFECGYNYDKYMSVYEYCIINDLNLIEVLTDNSNYHINCTIN